MCDLPELTFDNLLAVTSNRLDRWFRKVGWARQETDEGHLWYLPDAHFTDIVSYGLLMPRPQESPKEHVRLVRAALYHLVTHPPLLDGAMRTVLMELLKEGG